MPSESTQTGFLGRLAMSASVKKCRVYGLRSKDCESPRTMLVMNSHTMSSMIATDSGSGALASPYPYIISSTAAGHRVNSVRTQSRNSTRVHASWSARNWVRVVATRLQPTHASGGQGVLRTVPFKRPAPLAVQLADKAPCSHRPRSASVSESCALGMGRFSPRGAPRPVGVAAVAAPPLCIRARGCANPAADLPVPQLLLTLLLQLTSNKLLAPATARRA